MTEFEQHLSKELGLSDEALTICLRESEITGEPIDTVLVRNGLASHSALTAVRAKMDETSLMLSASFTTPVDPGVLREHRITVCGETREHMYVASPTPEPYLRDILAPWLVGRELIVLPFVPARHESFLAGLKDDGEETDYEDPISVVREALRYGASDVHISPKQGSYEIRLRVLGVPTHLHEGRLEEYQALLARTKDRARMDISEQRIPQDGEFQVPYGDGYVDLRVVTIPTVFGEKIVVRVLDQQSSIFDLEDLGITNLDAWKAAVSRSDGLTLVVGPTGSGKTTTLDATVRSMDRLGQFVYTAERPVEYRIGFTNQVNVVPEVGMSYSAALRAFMRGDPDTIINGEVRDEETAGNIIQAAETGHRVLGTLHATDARGVVPRLRHLGVDDLSLRSTLRGVLSQRQVRTLCSRCGGTGCDRCRNGYAGRTVVSECVYLADAKEVDAFMDPSIPPWWDSIISDAWGKVEAGITDRRELVRVFGEADVAHEEARRG